MSNDIVIFSCGGTFDKSKFTKSGKFVCGEPKAKEILGLANNSKIKIKSVIKKDSLDMDLADRQLLAKSIKATKSKNIVVVHGTDTMVETALFLQAAIKDKTIILTGAMSPAIFINSDAAFNLGFALGLVNLLKKGVYIAMHGECFAAQKVRKNRKLMKFVKK